MSIVCILRPQLKRNAMKYVDVNNPHPKHYNYFTIIDGQATFINGWVDCIKTLRVAKVVITGKSKNGNAQFGRVIEFLEFEEIQKDELIDYVQSDKINATLFSCTWGLNDDVYKHQVFNLSDSTYSTYNIYCVNLSIPLNSNVYAFYKTKYGIEHISYSRLNGSFRFVTFRKDVLAFGITNKDVIKPITIVEQLAEIDNINLTHDIKLRRITGYKTSDICKNHEDFDEIINCEDLEVPEYNYMGEFEGTLFYGSWWAFSIKCGDYSVNTTFFRKHTIKVRNFPCVIQNPHRIRYANTPISGKLYKHPTMEFYYIDIETIGELIEEKRTSGYSSYGDAENRRNGIDS